MFANAQIKEVFLVRGSEVTRVERNGSTIEEGMILIRVGNKFLYYERTDLLKQITPVSIGSVVFYVIHAKFLSHLMFSEAHVCQLGDVDHKIHWIAPVKGTTLSLGAVVSC